MLDDNHTDDNYNDPEHDDRVWSVRQAAEFLSRSPRTVRRWRQQGRIPCVVDPGGHLRFRAGSLRKMVREAEGWLG